jgi:hypothetical protein
LSAATKNPGLVRHVAIDDYQSQASVLLPTFCCRPSGKLQDLGLSRSGNDREIEYVNNHARPSGAERLLVAELIARGLEGFVKNSVRTPRITEELCLPAFEHSAHQPYAWPRSR